MLNSPVNFNDPTGHMCSDPEDPTPSCDGSGGHLPNIPHPNPPLPDNSGGVGSEEDQTDVTEWLANELNTQLGDDDLANPMGECVTGGFECTYGKIGGLYGSHLNLFGNYGKYDIKRKMQGIRNGSVVICGQEGCRWVDYSAPGNIMFGYLSAARGVEQGVSWLAGGALEIRDWATDGRKNGLPYTGEFSSYGDNPGDKAAVDFGYSLYEQYPNGFELTDFQAALTTEVLATFQGPSVSPNIPALPQSNSYPGGYFLNP